ncbi:MAG: transposase, partial [Ekhidna sp.]
MNSGMPRRPRAFLPDVPVHLIQRGNNRQVCFYADQDYATYLDKLLESSRACGVAIHSYVLMTNHVHLLCSPSTTDGVSSMMQGLGRYFVRYINATYDRSGTLWEGRFKVSMVNTEKYLLTVSRYIELNPVRARMVDHPVEYPWSSYRNNGAGVPIRLITHHPVYLRLGRSNSERQRRYRALFDQEMPKLTLDQIRMAANKSWVLGDGHFKRQVEKQLGYRIPPLPRGGDRKSKLALHIRST